MTLATLRADARFLALGDSSNSTDFGDTDLDRYLNMYYHKAGNIASMYSGGWQAFGEIIHIDIVADQNEYLLTDTDVNLRRIQRVWIKPTSSGDYMLANRRDMSNVSVNIDNYHPYPPEYDLLEDSLFIYLAENSITAVTKGIKMYIQTDITELSESSDIPQLPDCVQEYLSMGATYKFCLSRKDNRSLAIADRLKGELLEKEEEIKIFYSNRADDQVLKITPSSDESMDGDDLY